MDTYSHQKLPANQAVANTPPNHAAWRNGARVDTVFRAMLARPEANTAKLKTCSQPCAWPLPGMAIEAA
jgi:hypothetical protein